MKKNLGLLLLRIAVGLPFVLHGVDKFVNKEQALPFFTNLFGSAGNFLFHLTAVTEIVGGLFLIFGIFTCYATAALVVVMLVAIVKAKLLGFVLPQIDASPTPVPFYDKFSFIYNVIEIDIVLLFGLLAEMFLGSGAYSVHKWCACKCHALAEKCGLCKAVGCGKGEGCHAGHCHDHGHSHHHGDGHTHA